MRNSEARKIVLLASIRKTRREDPYWREGKQIWGKNKGNMLNKLKELQEGGGIGSAVVAMTVGRGCIQRTKVARTYCRQTIRSTKTMRVLHMAKSVLKCTGSTKREAMNKELGG